MQLEAYGYKVTHESVAPSRRMRDRIPVTSKLRRRDLTLSTHSLRLSSGGKRNNNGQPIFNLFQLKEAFGTVKLVRILMTTEGELSCSYLVSQATHEGSKSDRLPNSNCGLFSYSV